MMNDLIRLAKDINARRPHIAKARQYYSGNQPVSFLGSKLQSEFATKLQSMSANRCSMVVDLLADRLEVRSFTGEGSEIANKLWQEFDADLIVQDVHQEALLTGDAFVLVLPNAKGIPTIYEQRSENIGVIYEEEDLQEVRVAGKAWRLSDSKWRFNLYYPDRIEKYVTSEVEGSEVPIHEAKWERHKDAGDSEWPVKLNFGRVPIFHFSNSASRGCYGRSELDDIYPLQDALNNVLASQLIALEFQSYPQRWVAGLHPQINEDGTTRNPFPAYGPGELLITNDSDVKFGQFATADLGMYESMAEGIEIRLARTARIPMHYLQQTGSQISGETLKTAEAPMVSKLSDRTASFGAVWSQAIEFLLELNGITSTNIRVLWKDVETRSEVNFWTNAVIKNQLGVSQTQILREAGYSQEDIERFEHERSVESSDLAEAMLTAFDRG